MGRSTEQVWAPSEQGVAAFKERHHWYAGRSTSELAASLGLDRKTIRKYLTPAEAAGMTPGGAAMTGQDWAELIKGWFPDLTDKRLRQVTWPEIDKHRA
ncbi:hypothetical protein ACIBJC_14755 [Streptomyces sp. NPDC050509]|uniref:hypothetical protein n=1 Tax=Streptomyces sp. NPDC050509 TaxID=3365620 RepID=UPI00379F6B34